MVGWMDERIKRRLVDILFGLSILCCLYKYFYNIMKYNEIALNDFFFSLFLENEIKRLLNMNGYFLSAVKPFFVISTSFVVMIT